MADLIRQSPDSLNQSRTRSISAQPDWPLRHVAVKGAAHNGCTMLACLLGRIEGVGNIGEAHRLTHCDAVSGARPIDFDLPHSELTPGCHSCGPSCPVLTTAFRRSLQQSPGNWFYKIARQLDTQVLVSVEKNPVNFQNTTPNFESEQLIVFKSPVQSWNSRYRQMLLDNGAAHTSASIEVWAREWVDVYSSYLRDEVNTGVKSFIFFDALCERSKTLFPRLKTQLGLGLKRDTDKTQHYLIDNTLSSQSQKYSIATARIKPLKPTSLPDRDVRYISAHREIQAVFHDMKSLANFDLPLMKVAS